MMLVQKTKYPSLSAANGQFMMFETSGYRSFQWHSRVKGQHVEDIRLARMLKSEGLKMAVLLGNKDVFCSMYSQLDEAILGFSRNIHEYFGGKRFILVAFWFLTFFGPFIVWWGLGIQFLIIFGALVISNRLLVAWTCRQYYLGSVLLHPLQMISFTAIIFYNIYRRIRKDTEWKGRKIRLQD
jgi:chlorobactene glucosyltransferase